jgi:hypothetical protein
MHLEEQDNLEARITLQGSAYHIEEQRGSKGPALDVDDDNHAGDILTSV